MVTFWTQTMDLIFANIIRTKGLWWLISIPLSLLWWGNFSYDFLEWLVYLIDRGDGPLLINMFKIAVGSKNSLRQSYVRIIYKLIFHKLLVQLWTIEVSLHRPNSYLGYPNDKTNSLKTVNKMKVRKTLYNINFFLKNKHRML